MFEPCSCVTTDHETWHCIHVFLNAYRKTSPARCLATSSLTGSYSLGFEVSVAAAPPRGTAQPSLLDQPTMLQLVVVIVVEMPDPLGGLDPLLDDSSLRFFALRRLGVKLVLYRSDLSSASWP